MTRFLQVADAADFAALADRLRMPVLLADAQIHRRVAVHYLWIPGNPSPQLHREIPAVLAGITGKGFTNLAIIDGARATRLRYWRITLEQPS